LKTLLALTATLVTGMVAGHGDTAARSIPRHALARSVAPATFTVYQGRPPRGLMVTTGGWAYCEQVRALARRTGYALLCSRYLKDGYLGYGLRRVSPPRSKRSIGASAANSS
jgi:hypothetical protein